MIARIRYPPPAQGSFENNLARFIFNKETSTLTGDRCFCRSNLMTSFSLAQQLRLVALTAGTLLALAHQFTKVPPFVDYAFFVVLVVFIGIPHGALDHLVDEQTLKARNRSYSLRGFLTSYLLQMAAYALLWTVFPSLSLLLFLVFSAWHFGESDLHPAPRHLLWSAVQFTLGTAVLFFILLREPGLTGDLIYRITRENDLARMWWAAAAQRATPLLAILGAAILAATVMAQRQEPVKLQATRWAPFFAVLLVVSFLPLLPAFALYFGGWHALNTFQHMRDYLAAQHTSINLWKKAMPFTILAVSFLTLSGLLWRNIYPDVDPLPILFIFISIITFPHLLVIHNMLRLQALARSRT